MDVKEALRLQKENNFVILDVRPEAEYKAVSSNLLSLNVMIPGIFMENSLWVRCVILFGISRVILRELSMWRCTD